MQRGPIPKRNKITVLGNGGALQQVGVNGGKGNRQTGQGASLSSQGPLLTSLAISVRAGNLQLCLCDGHLDILPLQPWRSKT